MHRGGKCLFSGPLAVRTDPTTECMCAQWLSSVQFSSVAQSCPTHVLRPLRSTAGLPVHHQLPEFTQTHVY